MSQGGQNLPAYSMRYCAGLMDTHLFCKTKLNTQLQNEKFFWKELVQRLENFNDFNNNLKSIIRSNRI